MPVFIGKFAKLRFGNILCPQRVLARQRCRNNAWVEGLPHAGNRTKIAVTLLPARRYLAGGIVPPRRWFFVRARLFKPTETVVRHYQV